MTTKNRRRFLARLDKLGDFIGARVSLPYLCLIARVRVCEFSSIAKSGDMRVYVCLILLIALHSWRRSHFVVGRARREREREKERDGEIR